MKRLNDDLWVVARSFSSFTDFRKHLRVCKEWSKCKDCSFHFDLLHTDITRIPPYVKLKAHYLRVPPLRELPTPNISTLSYAFEKCLSESKDSLEILINECELSIIGPLFPLRKLVSLEVGDKCNDDHGILRNAPNLQTLTIHGRVAFSAESSALSNLRCIKFIDANETEILTTLKYTTELNDLTIEYDFKIFDQEIVGFDHSLSDLSKLKTLHLVNVDARLISILLQKVPALEKLVVENKTMDNEFAIDFTKVPLLSHLSLTRFTGSWLNRENHRGLEYLKFVSDCFKNDASEIANLVKENPEMTIECGTRSFLFLVDSTQLTLTYCQPLPDTLEELPKRRFVESLLAVENFGVWSKELVAAAGNKEIKENLRCQGAISKYKNLEKKYSGILSSWRD